MADVRKVAARQFIPKTILKSAAIPVVSNLKCLRLSRGRNGFGLTLRYCPIQNPSCGMKFEMDEEENNLGRDFNVRDDASGSDADVSSESSDTPCSRRQNTSSAAIEKAFIRYVIPRSPADQAGLVEGDEVVNLNNSAVYRRQVLEIEKLVQNSNIIDLDVIEHDVKQTNKGKTFQGHRWNDLGIYANNHENASDNGSSLSLTSGSSDNGTSPSSPSPSVQTGDRCFVVTYGNMPERKILEKHRVVKMRSFPLPSYSDEEAIMESKPVFCPDVAGDLGSIHRPQIHVSSSQVTQVDNNDGKPVFGVNNPGNGIGLTSSTSSSVLVESLDSCSKSNQPCCMTMTTATYSTLASPQTTRGESGYGSKEDGSDTSDNRLKMIQGDNNVWELRVAQPTHVGSRSPSPVQRRVSYLMATEGNPSLSSGSCVVIKSVGEANNNLVPLKEESNSDLSRSTCHYEGGSDMFLSDADEHTNFNVGQDSYVLVTCNSSEPLPLESSKSNNENGSETAEELSKFVMEEKRHSLKRKCSVEGPPEIEMEGYLSRKLGGSHGRRTWKQVYVTLKAHALYICKDKPDQITNSGQEEKPISIKSCIIDIAYDYRKRENVFRLTTYNGSLYLFQAKDKESMMSWIGVIQKNNNPDEDKTGVTSENLIVRRKKNMDNEMSSGQVSTKQVSKPVSSLKKSLSFKTNSGSQSSFKNNKKAIDGESGKAWHNKVVSRMKKISGSSSSIPQYQLPGCSVGVPLERSPTSKNNPILPLLVEHCCQVVESKGLESVGIYRVPGNSASVAALEEELNAKTPETIDFEEQKWNDANNMGSLLKKFLGKLPEGLVTSELYDNFIEANRKGGEERMWALKQLIQQLPCAYGETLSFLIRHLKKVSEHSDTNKMEIRNLAIVFGPTIVRTGEDNMMTMVKDMSDRFRIVESFITNYNWFFDKEPISNGVADHTSPNSPPVEEFSQRIVSPNVLTSIERAADSYESNDRKIKSPSIKLPNFLNLKKHNSESSKKPELSPDQTTEPVYNVKFSPVTMDLSPYNTRHMGGSQPNSPSTGRRKCIKRHHSTSNIPTTELQDDFDRSKSEGEDEAFVSRPSVATKAYSYARPPPPSYQAFRNKVPSPVNKELSSDMNSESKDFNSLSEETKKRLLKVTLRKKVGEMMRRKTSELSPTEPLNKTQNAAFEISQNVAASAVVIGGDTSKMVSHPSEVAETMNGLVVGEPQLKPSEIKERFESYSEDNQKANQDRTNDAGPQLRRRDFPVPWSSSRNFKIYSTPEMNFSQYRPDQINEWVQDMGQSSSGVVEKGEGDRGRSRAKTEEIWKERRAISVRRSVEENEGMGIKRQSLSCQDIYVEDDGNSTHSRTISKSSDSSDTSDDDNTEEASSKAFDEKLRGMLQRNKLENKSVTEIFQNRKISQTSCPPSYRASRSSVDKIRAIDPSSKIQSGAVSSIKSLFESGVSHQHKHLNKSRSSSLSSNSSESFMSCSSQRRKSTSSTHTVSDAEVKRRVWESDVPTGGNRKQWKEPAWVAKERAMKHLKSESEPSSPSDDNNNNVPNHKMAEPDVKHYSRSASLPVTKANYTVKDVVVEPAKTEGKTKVVVGKSNVAKKIVGEKIMDSLHSSPGTIKVVSGKVTIATPNQPSAHPKHEDTSGLRVEHVAGFKTRHQVIYATKSDPASDPASTKQKPRSRRRIVSERCTSSESRNPNVRTFTAPILGTVVTTTTPFALEGFAIKPESKNRASRYPTRNQCEKQGTGFVKPHHVWQPKQTLDIPASSLPQGYGSPQIRRKETLPVPNEEFKRLSTDRSLLEQNALHIKELLDEMNTEHSLKMERQKSDTISIDAQTSARKRALRRRFSLGGENDVVASRLSSSNVISGRRETKPSHSTTKNDIQRNLSTVKWVGVSS